jgi:hypothetical protein
MKIFTADQTRRLLANGRKTATALAEMREPPDHRPVVKLFTPDAACTWLLTEIDPDDPDIAFGLCDLGMGFPELGSVNLSELRQLRGRLGLPVEREFSFEAEYPVSVYARAAYRAEGIVTGRASLEDAAEDLQPTTGSGS